jgi:hypothetical protein
MAIEIHQHPDGLVFVRVQEVTYVDTPENLALDFGEALPPLPEGADDRIYAPGVRHALMHSERGFVGGGPMPWDVGDRLIAKVADAVVAQHNRRNPPPTLEQAKVQKSLAIEAEFQRRTREPITFMGHQWHADDQAVQNIMGVVLMIVAGVAVPDPRPWTPKDAPFSPVQMTHAELVGLGTAIAMRKDALFTAKRQKQQEILALGTVAAVIGYDIVSGWAGYPSSE